MVEKKYSDEKINYENLRFKNSRRTMKYGFLSKILDCVQMVAVYLYSANKVITNSISVGAFTVTIGAINTFSESVKNLIDNAMYIKYLDKYIDSFKDYLDGINTDKRELKKDLDVKTKKTFSTIEFKDVSFKYPHSEKLVLKNINLKIRAGEKISIVGLNGAGKSTLIKLLCGLYYPASGDILIDGISISEISLHEYRTLFSVVWQDFKLFPFSIQENIVLNQRYDTRKLQYAIETSGLYDKIYSLGGTDKILGKGFDKNSIEFSGGEKQRLAYARVLYRDSPIIVLDEPTSALDVYAETEMYNQYANLSKGKTGIYISHRMTLSKFCDKVFVMVDGRIIESGSHNDLMKRDGVYSDMYNKQSFYYSSNKEQ